MILIRPAAPSALNWAGGVVRTSIRSISLAGIDCRLSPAAEPENWVDGLPSIRMRTLLSPRNETLPSGATSTDGTAMSTALSLPKAACTSAVTLYTLRSIKVSTASFWVVTTTDSNGSAGAGVGGSAAFAAWHATRAKSPLQRRNLDERTRITTKNAAAVRGALLFGENCAER